MVGVSAIYTSTGVGRLLRLLARGNPVLSVVPRLRKSSTELIACSLFGIFCGKKCTEQGKGIGKAGEGGEEQREGY